MNLTDISRTFFLTTAEHILLKYPWNIFQYRPHFRLQKKSISKCEKIATTSTIFFNHKGMKLEINNMKNWKTPT